MTEAFAVAIAVASLTLLFVFAVCTVAWTDMRESRTIRDMRTIIEHDTAKIDALTEENGKLARALEAPKVLEIKEEDVVKEILEAIRTTPPRAWVMTDDGWVKR